METDDLSTQSQDGDPGARSPASSGTAPSGRGAASRLAPAIKPIVAAATAPRTATLPGAPDETFESARRPAPGFRAAAEATIALVILVVLFRTFLAGGYMIETGSMAPCLLGFHKWARCPDCQYRFAVDGTSGTAPAICPNCGRLGISLEELLLNDGDHLLVSRTAFDFADPQRWNVIVFSNPDRPRQAYVKRLAGLPGESLQIRHGDLFINGEIQPKDYATQKGMRILVHDHSLQPRGDDPNWERRWNIEPARAGWSERGGRFLFAPIADSAAPATAATAELEWVSYRHWIRSGGAHRTSVQLSDWPAALPPSALFDTELSYRDDSRTLICRGVMSGDLRARLEREAASASFRQSLKTLFEASHIAPIRDAYGYNHSGHSEAANEIRDLMFSARVALRGGTGLFVVALTDGNHSYRCEFDTATQEIRLKDEQRKDHLRLAELPASLAEGALVEISLWDGQILVAVDGRLPFAPHTEPAPRRRGPTPWQPVRFAAQGLRAEVGNVQLFRDVYYTTTSGDRAQSRPLTLGPDEYFVLGDNSPISKDSRSWAAGMVLHRDLFIGKPLFVHLPSRRHRLKLGGWQTEIRIPELSRVRYIH